MAGKYFQSFEHLLKPDPQFGSLDVSKFISCIMKDGKRTTAERILYDAFEMVQQNVKDREPLVLSVDRDGRYFLNIGGDEDSPVSEAEIARRAGAVLARDPATPVLVKADERVPYGSVVRGMVLLQQAGATKLGFLTDPKAVRALEELERRR